MTFKESIHAVSTKVAFKLLFPRWVFGITAGLRHLRDAFDDFDARGFTEFQEVTKFVRRSEIHDADDRVAPVAGIEGRAG
jgi:hypothetical protein